MTMETSASAPSCFVIGPIGEAGTDIRDHADMLLSMVIEPVLSSEEFNFSSIDRADRVGVPGSITSQVILAIESADLVIADLTFNNANAFYELGLAHTFRRPTIHMAAYGHKLPFDNQDYRTIFFGTNNPDNINTAQNDLAAHVQTVVSDGYETSNPVTHALGVRDVSRQGDDEAKILNAILSSQEKLVASLNEVGLRVDQLEKPRTFSEYANAERILASSRSMAKTTMVEEFERRAREMFELETAQNNATPHSALRLAQANSDKITRAKNAKKFEEITRDNMRKADPSSEKN